MNPNLRLRFSVIGVALIWAVAAHAGPPKDPPSKCAPDAVLVGPVCVDTYEASVWRIPSTNASGDSNAGLIKKVRKGKATAADLTAGNATQVGIVTGDYAPCTDNGQTCKGDVYAASLPGMTPSGGTWFQANVACANSGKRLPSNAEWQMAVTGTPDTGGADNGTTDCNTDNLVPGVALTGARTSCVSAFGAFDMVGNRYEWVADWVPLSGLAPVTATPCPGWGGFSDDHQCFAGADTVATDGPGALGRGGIYSNGSGAGPLAVTGTRGPFNNRGFRCVR